MAGRYEPRRGDIIWIDHSPTKGREQSGMRPSFVISNDIYNRVGFVIVCPITSKIKGYGSEAKLPSELKTQGVVLTDQIRTIDWEHRKIKFKEKTKPEFYLSIYQRINSILKPMH